MTTIGLLNIDKPGGQTSHDVVNRLRQVTGQRRVGHAGTLDPLATGVLLVCVGRATRLLEYLVGQSKRYTAVIRLGQSTDTYDADGTVVAKRPLAFNQADLARALSQFQGEIEQLPPLYSSVKVKGQPLYKLARRGIEVERQPRTVTIYELNIIQYNPPNLEIDLFCSSGTYVRSLAHDLGETLNCGGHIAALRRTAVGAFTADTAVSLDHLSAENLPIYLQPLDTAVSHLPRRTVAPEDAAALWQGKTVEPQNEPPETGTLFRVYEENGAFVGIVQAGHQGWQPHKMFPPVK